MAYKSKTILKNNDDKVVELIAGIRAQNCGMPIDCESVSPLVEDWLIFADRLEAAYKKDTKAKDKKCRFLEKRIKGYVEIIENKQKEVARLRAAIKPVLEVKLIDADDCKGIGRQYLTTPCAVCDWWSGDCDQECEVLAVFKAAKECQRIYKESEVSNG